MTSEPADGDAVARGSTRAIGFAPGAALAGRFVLSRRLGSGGMGEVWEARDRALGRRVAVKLPLAGSRTEAMRLRREARIAALISHPSVTSVFDVGLEAGRPFVVMELVEGPSLRSVIGERALRPLEAARLGAGIAAGLAAIHARGIVHGDVKPDNVVLAGDGRPKLTDLGVASQPRSRREAAHRTGPRYGTIPFVAPELAGGGRPTAASDVFALGRTLAVMLGPGDGGPAAGRLRAVIGDATAADRAARPSAGAIATVLRAIAAGGTGGGGAGAVTTAIPQADGPARHLHGSRTTLLEPARTNRLTDTTRRAIPVSAPASRTGRARARTWRAGLALVAATIVAGCLALAVFATVSSTTPHGAGRSPGPSSVARTTMPGSRSPSRPSSAHGSVPARPVTRHGHGSGGGNGHGQRHGHAKGHPQRPGR
jgi:hypothetical protein